MLQYIDKIKIVVRTPSALFWTLLFPIFLGTMFYFMFGNIDVSQQFSEIPVGIYEEEKNDMFLQMLENAGTEADGSILDPHIYESIDAAEEALKNGEIAGYVIVKGASDTSAAEGKTAFLPIQIESDFELVVKEMDISATVIKVFLDQYKQISKLLVDTAIEHPEQIVNVAKGLSDSGIEIEEIPLKGQDKSPYTQYFFALIAMVCLIASQYGLENGVAIQADQTSVGARRNVSPTPKLRQVVADFLGTYTIYCLMMLVVLAVVVFVFKQDFGTNGGLIVLNAMAGCFTGQAAGTMISVIFPGNKKKKESIAALFFMGSSFLGGLMWGDITYMLEKSCPIINRINPATLIVNGFKSIAVFGNYNQYFVNLATLLGMGVLFLAVSVIKLRRQRYASI